MNNHRINVLVYRQISLKLIFHVTRNYGLCIYSLSFHQLNESEACVAQRLRNGLPCDCPGFNSRSERCIYRASRPSQGTVNVGAVSK